MELAGGLFTLSIFGDDYDKAIKKFPQKYLL